MNLPNKLTIIRIALTPFFLLLFLSDLPNHYLLGLVVFALGSFTDFLDGKIARKNGVVTVFGQLADPIADKILTTSALLAFMQLGLCNIWIIVIILLREFTISSIRLVATSQGVVIPANIYGKIKTATQMIFSIAVMVMCQLQYAGILKESFPLTVISNILLSITAFFTVVSGAVYVKQSLKIIDFSK